MTGPWPYRGKRSTFHLFSIPIFQMTNCFIETLNSVASMLKKTALEVNYLNEGKKLGYIQPCYFCYGKIVVHFDD